MARREEAGATIVELLVVMVLFGIIGGFVMSSLVTAMQNARATSERATALHDIERALQVVGRELRVADPLLLDEGRAFGTAIGAVVYRDGKAQVHTFVAETTPEGRYLTQQTQVYEAAALGPGGPTEDTPVLSETQRRLVFELGQDLDVVFRYRDAEGGLFVCPEETPVTGCRPHRVVVELVRELPSGEEIRADSTIGIRNLRYQRISP